MRHSNVVSMERLPLIIHAASITDQTTTHNLELETPVTEDNDRGLFQIGMARAARILPHSGQNAGDSSPSGNWWRAYQRGVHRTHWRGRDDRTAAAR